MKIVIDIPDEQYNDIAEHYNTFPNEWKKWGLQAIKNGIPLPKSHGRLIDADALLKDVRNNSESYFADDFAREWVDVAPTIIEADRSEKE